METVNFDSPEICTSQVEYSLPSQSSEHSKAPPRSNNNSLLTPILIFRAKARDL